MSIETAPRFLVGGTVWLNHQLHESIAEMSAGDFALVIGSQHQPDIPPIQVLANDVNVTWIQAGEEDEGRVLGVWAYLDGWPDDVMDDPELISITFKAGTGSGELVHVQGVKGVSRIDRSAIGDLSMMVWTTRFFGLVSGPFPAGDIRNVTKKEALAAYADAEKVAIDHLRQARPLPYPWPVSKPEAIPAALPGIRDRLYEIAASNLGDEDRLQSLFDKVMAGSDPSDDIHWIAQRLGGRPGLYLRRKLTGISDRLLTQDQRAVLGELAGGFVAAALLRNRFTHPDTAPRGPLDLGDHPYEEADEKLKDFLADRLHVLGAALKDHLPVTALERGAPAQTNSID